MAVKIKVSYEHPEELQHILRKLQPDVRSWKVARRQEGRFKRAYIELKGTVGAKLLRSDE